TSTAAPTQFAAITRLTYDPGNATHPAWSPDNQTIAFESNRDGANHIYIMNADGTHSRALTFGANDDRHATWMPDGKNILYDSSDDMHQDIWIVNAENGNRKQLTRVNGLADYAAPSPDGQRIAFYVYKEMTLNIWSARADGSDAKQLTRDFANGKRNESTISWGRPAWSPDSQLIAYTGADGKSIWLMRSDGTGARAIIADDETNHFPFFLADGRLAFITEYVPPRYGAAWTNAWAYDLKTGARALLHEYMSMQEPLAWNADISKLLFASPRNGRFDIYLIDTRAPGGIVALRDNLNVSSAQSGEVNR
ncbi:MAG: PD40 domain-containing protein, partial [Chloroflexi bacterium]|nr:PD40 domain-containing protein [Chloroflexota bacterium]